jgi:cytochrome P450
MKTPLLERTIETIVLAAAAWPFAHSGVSVSFWRTFPHFARRLAVLVSAYLLLVVGTMLWGPLWLTRTMAIAAGVWLVALSWHGRIVRGRSKGWPPGALRLLPLDAWFDRRFFFEQSRRLRSPFKTSHFFRPMVCFVGFPDGWNFLKEHESALASPSLPFGRFIPNGFIRHMTPDRHAATKQLFRNVLAREVYEPLQPFVRETIRRELNRIVTLCGSKPSGIAPRSHIQRVVFAIWAQLFFNISNEVGLSSLKQLYKVVDIRNPMNASDGSIDSTLEEIERIVKQQLHEDEASRGEAPRFFFEALAALDAGAIDDPTVVRNLIYLLHTSWADVSGLLVWLWRMMTEHAQWAESVRNGHRQGGVDEGVQSLSTRIVMETLRLEQSEQLYRVTTRQIQHGHFVIPKGWLVRLCVRESHQDPSVFERPDVFDPDRFLHHTFTRREYSVFGGTLRHACLGEGLTTMVGRIFVEEVCGMSWETTADGEYEYGPWRHWRPSSAWRVRLAAP